MSDSLEAAAAWQLFGALLESDTPVLVADRHLAISHVSPGFADALGRDQQLVGGDLEASYGPELAAAASATLADRESRTVLIAVEGAAPIELAMFPLTDAEASEPEHLLGVLVVAASLQEEYRLRADVAISDARFRVAFENSPLGVAVTRGEVYRQVNEAYARMLGRRIDELIGRRFAEFTHPEDLADDIDALRELLAGARQMYATEKRYLRSDGTIVHGRVHVTPLPGPEPGMIFVQVEDITEAKAAEAAREELLAELRAVAETLQSSLLPASLPAIPGLDVDSRYWPAGTTIEVGGDFYDVFALGDNRWALLIGDVCGRGVQAAAMTSMARHTIRSAAFHLQSPAQVLTWLNDALMATADQRPPFITALYGWLEPHEPPEGGFRFRFASAGHPLPKLVVAGEGASLGAPGSLLGVFGEALLDEQEVHLPEGATLILYTDGCTDAPGRAGLADAEFTELCRRAVADAEAGQGRTATAEAVVDRIRDALESLKPIAERDDDLALLVLRPSA